MIETRLNFDLRLTLTQDGYRAQVLESPAGQAVSDFTLPFSELELENFLLRIGQPKRELRREIGQLGPSKTETLKSFGGKLFEAVFDGEVRSCLARSLDEAGDRSAGLRIRLRLNETPDLSTLPWEYLYNPDLNRFFCLSERTPLVRYLDLPERVQALKIDLPLKLLVMISAPSDYPQLDVAAEWSKLKEALSDLEQRGLVELTKLDTATLASLQNLLKKDAFHIFHYIGHGGLEQQTQSGVLVLEDDQNRGRLVSGEHLGVLLHDHASLRLAVLNACEGARSGQTDPFSGVAQRLVQQGVPAVVAMQFEIADRAAIVFAHDFYTALATNVPVDSALSQTRKAIFAGGDEVAWGTPVLFLRTPDTRLFELPPAAESATEFRPVEASLAEAITSETEPERVALLPIVALFGLFWGVTWLGSLLGLPRVLSAALSSLFIALALGLTYRGSWRLALVVGAAWGAGALLAGALRPFLFALFISNPADREVATPVVQVLGLLLHFGVGIATVVWYLHKVKR